MNVNDVVSRISNMLADTLGAQCIFPLDMSAEPEKKKF